MSRESVKSRPHERIGQPRLGGWCRGGCSCVECRGGCESFLNLFSKPKSTPNIEYA